MDLPGELDGVAIGFGTGAAGVRPGRPSLVCIHGTGGSRATWRFQLEGLEGAMNVAAPDLPGHGRTPGPVLSSVAALAEWTARVLETWNLPAPVVLAGHSLGGAVALETALRRPDLLGGLILLATGARLAVNPVLFEGLEKDFAGTVGLIGQWAVARSADPAVVRELGELMAANPPATLITDFRACDEFDRRPDLGRLDLPVLIVCGEKDKMTPLTLSEFLKENIRGSRLAVIPEAGHYVMNEKPAQVNQAVLEFVLGLG
ncbi:MAG: alpha/beta hydrolase [Thermodesulfobacteriota bacterium]